MSPLDNLSRHYHTPAVDDGPWHCPRCDAENSGPIAAGCTSCGSGAATARKAAPGMPSPPVPPARSGDSASAAPDTARHEIALEAAYKAGYNAGYAAGYREAQVSVAAAPPPSPAAAEGPDKIARTLIVALQLFAEQVLAGNPEEVITGEWLSAAEAGDLIAQLQRGRSRA